MIVLWNLAALNPNVASARYRCLIPVFESLNNGNSEIRHYVRSASSIDTQSISPDVAVFIKTVTEQDFKLAKSLKSRGVKVIFDTCDNLFDDHKEHHLQHWFKEMLKISDKVTVPTETLLQEICEEMGESFAQKIQVIPDPAENLKHIKFSEDYTSHQTLRDLVKDGKIDLILKYCFFTSFDYIQKVLRLKKVYRFYLRKVLSFCCISFIKRVAMEDGEEYALRFSFWQKLLFFPFFPITALIRITTGGRVSVDQRRIHFLRNLCIELEKKQLPAIGKKYFKTVAEPEIRILWFGNAGTYGRFGISDLLMIKKNLENLYQTHSVHLTIVSNSLEAFYNLSMEIDVPMDYIPWTLDKVYKIAKNYDCVVLPNTLNQFSKGKSANRTLLSLSLGLPVVATRTPELEKFSDCVLFEDWENSILAYKNDKDLKKKHLEIFEQVLVNSPHNPQRVWQGWLTLFTELH